MGIDVKDFLLENNHLKDTKEWFENEIVNIETNDDRLKSKIAGLKKQARGSYSEELETTLTLYEITHKTLDNYHDAINQPYFSRIDFREKRREKESFYIGKFGINDSKTGDEIIIDWRAPIADLYYSGTEGETYYKAPMGVINGKLSLKRKFIIKNGNLIDAFDDSINELILKNSADAEGNGLTDEFLRINLEESVSSKLKEIVATIQKEQNDIIRADKNSPVIVQGSAGSGKTTIALHRLAYLLYKYKDKIKGENILVLAPNKIFLDYISEVLPNLGVDKVKQKTFEQISIEILELKNKVYTKDKKLSFILENEDKEQIKYITNVSKIKGSMAYKTMMDRYLTLIQKNDESIGDITVDNYVLFESKEIKKLYFKDLVNLPIKKRKLEIKRYFKLKFNEKITNILDKVDFSYEYFISRTKKTMEDSQERRKKLIELYDERDDKKEKLRKKSREEFERFFDEWVSVSTDELYINLFQDKELLNVVTDNKIPEKLLDYMINEVLENEKNGIVDCDDLVPMLYLKFMTEGIDEKRVFKHLVIDEAQDYSEFQFETIRKMVTGDSFTIVGDLGQGIYSYRGINDWRKLVGEVFNGDANYTELTQSYRSTVEIIGFANKVLEKQKNSLKPATPVLRHGKEPKVIEFNNEPDFCKEVDSIVDQIGKLGRNNVAIIGRTLSECKKIKETLKKHSEHKWTMVKDTDKKIDLEKIIIPSYMTKGLEFDCSIIYNCSEENYGDTEMDKKILYVALTRALHFEYVFYKGKKSNLI